MRRRDLRVRLGGAALATALTLLALAVPGTAGAFSAQIVNTADSAATKSVFTCADLFGGTAQKPNAYFEYALDETAGATTATDSSSASNGGTYVGSNAKDSTTPKACPSDGGRPFLLDGTSSAVTTSTSTTFGSAVQPFTLMVWFKTSTASGKLIGFESSQGATPDPGQWDRMLYVGTSGKLFYGLYPNAIKTLTTPAAVTDGTWHQAVATTSASGSVLYVDGASVASDSSMTIGQAFTGWWHVGAGRYTYWPEASSAADTGFFTGSLRFAAALKYAMGATAVRSSYRIGAPA